MYTWLPWVHITLQYNGTASVAKDWMLPESLNPRLCNLLSMNVITYRFFCLSLPDIKQNIFFSSETSYNKDKRIFLVNVWLNTVVFEDYKSCQNYSVLFNSVHGNVLYIVLNTNRYAPKIISLIHSCWRPSDPVSHVTNRTILGQQAPVECLMNADVMRQEQKIHPHSTCFITLGPFIFHRKAKWQACSLGTCTLMCLQVKY